MTNQPPAPLSPPETPPEKSEEQPIQFDVWLGQQDEKVKAAYEEHVTGLKNTVKATREERDQFAKELRDAAGKVAKGSEAEKALNDMAAKYEVAERRASFYEEATRPEIGCRNPKVAFALAVADDLFDKKGIPNWTAIKAAAPELFGVAAPRSNAGNGTGSPPKNESMNDLIRRAAGRQ